MAKKRDYYEVLGISKNASTSEIKKAYFQMAKKYHPDTNKSDDAQTKFREASEAYEVLSNEEKKGLYDNFGHAGVDGSAGAGGGGPFGGGFNAHGFGFGGGQQVDLQDLFEELFSQGGGGRRRGPRPGANLEYTLQLKFMEAVHGCSKPIRFQYQYRASDGRVKTETRSATVEVPPGVERGMVVQMRGEGADSPDPGMPRGDLHVALDVGEDPYFKRDPRRAEDVHVTVPVSMATAALGGTIELLSLDGLVDLNVPPGAQPGSRLLMRGKGIRRVNTSGRGNQYVNLDVKIPRHLTERQKELLREFQKEGSSSSMSKGAQAAGGVTGAQEKSSGGGTSEEQDSSFTKLIQRTLRNLKRYLKDDKSEKNAA